MGAAAGVGIVIVLGPDACGLSESARVAHYLAGQSAGQCGPCVYGLPAIADDMTRLARGQVDAGLESRLERRLREVVGRGACRHPDGAVNLVRSALQVFAADVQAHVHGAPLCTLAAFHAVALPRRAEGGLSMLRILIDPVACDAYGYCAELLPEAISLDEWGYPIVDGKPLPPELVESHGGPPETARAGPSPSGSARAGTEQRATMAGMSTDDPPRDPPEGLVVRPCLEGDLARVVELLALGALPGSPRGREDPSDLGPYERAWREAGHDGGAVLVAELHRRRRRSVPADRLPAPAVGGRPVCRGRVRARRSRAPGERSGQRARPRGRRAGPGARVLPGATDFQ